MAAVELVGRLGDAPVDDDEGGPGRILQCKGQILFLLGAEGGEHPGGKVKFRIRLRTHTDLYPGEFLASQLGNDGFDPIVPPGGAVAPDPQPPRRQGDVVKHHQNPLRRDAVVGAQLQYRPARQIHIGLRLEKKELGSVVNGLPIQPLEFCLINPAAQFLCQQVDGTKARIVPGAGIFAAGIAQSDHKPALTIRSEHGSEQVGDGGTAVDVLDGAGKHGGHVQEFDFVAGGVAHLGNGVQEHDLLNGAVLDPLIGGAGEHTVGSAGEHCLCAAHLNQSVGRVAQGAGGIHHIVIQNAGLAPHVADDVHHLALIGLLTALVHNGEAHVNLLRKGAGAADGADIGGDNNKLGVVKFFFGEFLQIVAYKGGVAQQMIQGDIEEALNLRGVQIHGQHPVSAGGGDHIGDELCGDGVAALGLAILAGIAKIGNDGGDPPGRGAAAGVGHHQQLHQTVVYGLAGGLHQEHVGSSDSLIQGNGDLAVGKGLDVRQPHGNVQRMADRFSELGIGIA